MCSSRLVAATRASGSRPGTENRFSSSHFRVGGWRVLQRSNSESAILKEVKTPNGASQIRLALSNMDANTGSSPQVNC